MTIWQQVLVLKVRHKLLGYKTYSSFASYERLEIGGHDFGSAEFMPAFLSIGVIYADFIINGTVTSKKPSQEQRKNTGISVYSERH